MAFNYTKSKAALDTIAQRTERGRGQLIRMQDMGVAVESDLNQMQADYAGLVAEINAEAAARPADLAIQNLKLEKDKLAADFVALKTIAQDANAALATHINPIK